MLAVMLRSFYKFQKYCWLRSWGVTVQNDQNICLTKTKSSYLRKIQNTNDERASGDKQQNNDKRKDKLNLNSDEFWFNNCQLNFLEAVGLGTALVAGLRLSCEIEELKKKSYQRNINSSAGRNSCPILRLKNATIIFLNSNWNDIYFKSSYVYSLIQKQAIQSTIKSYVLPPGDKNITSDSNLSLISYSDNSGATINNSNNCNCGKTDTFSFVAREAKLLSCNDARNNGNGIFSLANHNLKIPPDNKHSTSNLREILTNFETCLFGTSRDSTKYDDHNIQPRSSSSSSYPPPPSSSSSPTPSPTETTPISAETSSVSSDDFEEPITKLKIIYDQMVDDNSNTIASNLARKGFYEKATLIWNDILSRNPTHTKSLFNMAMCYENGLWVDQDMNKAEELYKQASELGHVMATYRLAHIYKRLSLSLSSVHNEEFNLLNGKYNHYLLEASQSGHREAKKELEIMKLKISELNKGKPLLEMTAPDSKHRKAVHDLNLCKELNETSNEKKISSDESYKVTHLLHSSSEFNNNNNNVKISLPLFLTSLTPYSFQSSSVSSSLSPSSSQPSSPPTSSSSSSTKISFYDSVESTYKDENRGVRNRYNSFIDDVDEDDKDVGSYRSLALL